MKPDRERGSVTAELAAAFPVLVLLMGASVFGISAAASKLRCYDAARDAALAASRGEDGVAAGRKIAPSGADVTVLVKDDLVRAVVAVEVRPLGAMSRGYVIRGEAVAGLEPSS